MAANQSRRRSRSKQASHLSSVDLRDSDAEADSVNPWDYEPPEVAYVPIEKDDQVVGYRVEPPFGVDWPPLQTLRHFAALIEHRTGQKVRVAPSASQPPDYDDMPELFDVMTGHSTGGPAPFEIMYSWLSGFENGIHELLWSTNAKPAE